MKNKKRLLIRIVSALAVLLVIAAALVILWLNGAFLPGWIRWQDHGRIMSEGLTVSLNNRKTTVQAGSGQTVWKSPSNVKVQDVLCTDIDHDGEEELLLLCWKIGRYGDVVPRFGAGEEFRWFQHIYIYDLEEQSVHAIWMASEIGIDVEKWYPDEELLVLCEPSGRETKWVWDDWGLESFR